MNYHLMVKSYFHFPYQVRYSLLNLLDPFHLFYLLLEHSLLNLLDPFNLFHLLLEHYLIDLLDPFDLFHLLLLVEYSPMNQLDLFLQHQLSYQFHFLHFLYLYHLLFLNLILVNHLFEFLFLLIILAAIINYYLNQNLANQIDYFQCSYSFSDLNLHSINFKTDLFESIESCFQLYQIHIIME